MTLGFERLILFTVMLAVSSVAQAYKGDVLFLDASGRQTIPTSPEGTYPFGVSLREKWVKDPRTGQQRKTVSSCSCAHIAEGVVTMNNHCINGQTPNEHIVYFDKAGIKRTATVTKYRFKGDTNGLDLAIVEIDSDSAKSWHTLPGNGDRSGFVSRREMNRTQDVIVWSFDPVDTHPRIADYYKDQRAVVFNPKHCLGSERQPETRVSVDGKHMNIKRPGYSASAHLFLDECDSTIRSGNSGSIITLADDFSQKVGAVHWIYPYLSHWKLLSDNGLYGSNANYSYYGNRNRWEPMDMNQMEGNVYSIGTLFESMLRLKSSLFRPESSSGLFESGKEKTGSAARTRRGLQ